jgi:hypothetical protein
MRLALSNGRKEMSLKRFLHRELKIKRGRQSLDVNVFKIWNSLFEKM